MIRFFKDAGRENINRIIAFRKDILFRAPPSVYAPDKYDHSPKAGHFIAERDNAIFATARFIQANPDVEHLPMARYFKMGAFRKNGKNVFELSKLIADSSDVNNGAFIRFFSYLIQEAKKNNARYICTMVNTLTDNEESARNLYQTALQSEIISPDLHTQPLMQNSGPPKSKSWLHRDEPVTLPVPIRLYARIGFRITSIPIYIPEQHVFAVPMFLDLKKGVKEEFNITVEDNKSDSKQINCRSSNAIIKYARRNQADMKEILRDITFNETYLTNENNWVDAKTIMCLLRNTRIALKDPNAPYKIGASVVSLNSLGVIHLMLRLFGSPRLAFKITLKFQNIWNKVSTFEPVVKGPNKIVIIHQNRTVKPNQDICHLHAGLLHSIPESWNVACEVKEVECIRHGDDCCKFILTWDSIDSIPKRLYYFTIDRFVTLRKIRLVLQQKKNELDKKTEELTSENLQNIKLNRQLHLENKRLAEVINRKLKKLDIVYRKKLDNQKKAHRIHSDDLIENITGVITHEIKGNLSSMLFLEDRLRREKILEQTQQSLIKILKYSQEYSNPKEMKKYLLTMEHLNKDYHSIHNLSDTLAKTVKESVLFCEKILTHYKSSETTECNISKAAAIYCKNKQKYCRSRHIKMIIGPFVKTGLVIEQARLIRMMDNIVENALEALAQTKNDQKKIFIRTQYVNNQIHLQIGNNGPKIPINKREMIFHPFYSTDAQKTGLGLTFCQKDIKHYGGAITVTDLKKWTLFTIQFPLPGSNDKMSHKKSSSK